MNDRPAASREMLTDYVLARARELRGGDRPPPDLATWNQRRPALRAAVLKAMGPLPAEPMPLDVREVGILLRDGYRIEKLVIGTRPGVWASASAYVPEGQRGKVPAVLAVHGHWAGARRDPVVQSRCVGLAKLGFFVLALDAFGAGERHPKPALGAYHGGLLGSALWPVGHTLLGMQVYDNRRMVDYLLTRPEVDGTRLGITGASGGGNQTMYAGALDDRFAAVVPVCSVGTYQAYLQAACCVCEVLPGALETAEEGAILGLVAPRALLVISATQDASQFSVGEAAKSVAFARSIFQLHGAESKLAHRPFESPHAYNQAMRETMYGWMTRWLKQEGDGKPIPEPKIDLEKPEDLACFPDGKRPTGFLHPATFAASEARRLLAPFDDPHLDHHEAWESTSMTMREVLLPQVLNDRKRPRVEATLGKPEESRDVRSTPLELTTDPGIRVSARVQSKPVSPGRWQPAFLVLHLDGQAEAVKHPLAAALVERGAAVVAPDLRATGSTKPAHDAIASAPDHNSAEHGLWIGQPLLGQWVHDTRAVLDWMASRAEMDRNLTGIVAIGQAGVVALCAAALDRRVGGVVLVDPLTTLVTDEEYAAGTHMGLLAPGLLTVGDVPHLAALVAPRLLVVSGGTTPRGDKLNTKQVQAAFSFTRKVYGLADAARRLSLDETAGIPAIVERLLPGK